MKRQSDRRRILHVVGARPNFMKAGPVFRALEEAGWADQSLIHTGQHYDWNMSDVFFQQLALPEPDFFLGVGAGSHAQQTAGVMVGIEQVMVSQAPDVVVVYGDVNSTMAAAVVGAKLGYPVAHVEAGLRSFDMTMPEEINRMLTDRISNVLFTHCREADDNLLREGVPKESIRFVGNVMIDTLIRMLPLAKDVGVGPGLPTEFGLVTLHRPSNVDNPDTLRGLAGALKSISQLLPVVFPIHPRTRDRLTDLDINMDGVLMLDPLGYLEFLAMEAAARFVITDSGGVQEETTYLGVPCLTVRENTERSVTVHIGTNILVGTDAKALVTETERVLTAGKTEHQIPPLWDGNAGTRIEAVLREFTR